MPCACRRLQPRRGFALFFQLLYFFIFFFPPQRTEMSENAINKKKIINICLLLNWWTEGEVGCRQGSLALERSAARGSWAARGQHDLRSARPRGAASAARGAAERGKSAGPGLPGCTRLSPASPEPAAPAAQLGPPARADRGSSGVCRALSAFRWLAGVCANLPELGGPQEEQRVPGALGPRWLPGAFQRGQPPQRDGGPGGRRCVCECVCGRTGCSKLTTRVNLRLIWRQGSCRSHEWCSRLLWVKSRGGRRGGLGLRA